MNAIDLLRKQHRDVEDLFGKIDRGESREESFTKLADSLAAHGTIEEKIFYPAAYKNETVDMLREAVEEHLSIKRVLTDILAVGIEHETFEAKVKVLKEQVEHHVDEEESELFPKVKKLLAAEELDALGSDMQILFEELMQTEPRLEVPAETDQPAPLE